MSIDSKIEYIVGETGEVPTPRPPEGPLLPDISEHSKIVKAAKKQYQSFGAMVTLSGFPKEELDRLYLNWTGLQEVGSNMERLDEAISTDKLPELEKRDLKRELKEFRAITNPITSSIINLTKREKLGNQDLSPINSQIEASKEKFGWLEQVLALGEAIVETRDQNPDERLIRQRIGQAEWEELLNAFAWKKLHYAAESGVDVTTEDSLTEQKEELISALRRKPWGQRQTEKNRKVYQGLRKRISRTEEGIEILKNLKIVWDSARGSIPQGISALDIVKSGELALQDLDSEGAFEWDPEELEEEGEDQEVGEE